MSRALFYSFILMLVACGRGRKEKDILPPEKMQAVLYDMMRADQFISDFVVNKDTSRKRETESQYYYSRVFRIHQVSAESFRQSLAWYREHPEKLRALMDSISQPIKQVPISPATDTVPASAEPPPPPAPATDETLLPARKRRDSLLKQPVN